MIEKEGVKISIQEPVSAPNVREVTQGNITLTQEIMAMVADISKEVIGNNILEDHVGHEATSLLDATMVINDDLKFIHASLFRVIDNLGIRK